MFICSVYILILVQFTNMASYKNELRVGDVPLT